MWMESANDSVGLAGSFISAPMMVTNRGAEAMRENSPAARVPPTARQDHPSSETARIVSVSVVMTATCPPYASAVVATPSTPRSSVTPARLND